MKTRRFLGAPLSWRTLVLGTTASFLSVSLAHAATDIEVWYSLNSANKQTFEKLVKQFNSDQADVKVKLKAFDDNTKIESALSSSVKDKKTPNLVQLADNSSPEDIASRKYILPLYSLLAKYPVKDAKWFVADDNTFMRDGKGRLLAFPYMVDVPVMFYNVDAFKKAGLKPAEPNRSWQGLQDQLVTLANNGSRKCPLTTDQTVSVNLENLAAVNNQFYTTSDNGLKGKAAPVFAFDTMYVRHLSLMISWVRTELMVKPSQDVNAVKRFANGECAVLLSNSGNLGTFKDARSLNFGITGLPYYPQVTQKPGNAFVTGSALWAIDGHEKAEDKATSQFLQWLAQPKNASTWYQSTGYLPLTDKAYSTTSKSYYSDLGEWQSVVAAYQNKPVLTGRGFKINNYPEIKAMFQKKLDKALSGDEPAVVALKSAASEASQMMRQK
ncbi:MAG TPA: extracellular solute-binding protein [Eoetvoesiella sp.]